LERGRSPLSIRTPSFRVAYQEPDLLELKAGITVARAVSSVW
jgi:hypothetical protein